MIVSTGTPEEVATDPASHTGRWLGPMLARSEDDRNLKIASQRTRSKSRTKKAAAPKKPAVKKTSPAKKTKTTKKAKTKAKTTKKPRTRRESTSS